MMTKQGIKMGTVKLEMFADINVCEFAILKVFALLKFAILVLPKVNFLFPNQIQYTRANDLIQLFLPINSIPTSNMETLVRQELLPYFCVSLHTM